MISCWGYALLQVDWNKNLADVMANAVPFILFGGIGFAATYFLSWVLKKFAMRSAHHSKADPK